ncbi:hypothetical protein AB0323_15590 [Arthrobacter sp. NPDC080031]
MRADADVGFGEQGLQASGTIDFSDPHGDHKPRKDIAAALVAEYLAAR